MDMEKASLGSGGVGLQFLRVIYSITISRTSVHIILLGPDLNQDSGGATTFLFDGPGGQVQCQPGAGSVLIFSQDLLHEGSLCVVSKALDTLYCCFINNIYTLNLALFGWCEVSPKCSQRAWC